MKQEKTQGSAMVIITMSTMCIFLDACNVGRTSLCEQSWARVAAQDVRELRVAMIGITCNSGYARDAVTMWCYGAYSDGLDEQMREVMESFGYEEVSASRLEADGQASTVLFMRDPVQIGCVGLNQVERTERILWLALVPHAVDISMGYYIVVPSSYVQMAVELFSKDEELRHLDWMRS